MPEEAHEISVSAPIDMTGLDELFSCRDKTGQTELTLEDVAKRLNISERTVQRRLKDGQLRGYKVSGSRGPEWRILIESNEESILQLVPSTDDRTMASLGSTLQATPSTDDTTVASLDPTLQVTSSTDDTTMASLAPTLQVTSSTDDRTDLNEIAFDEETDATTVEPSWYAETKTGTAYQELVQQSFAPELKTLLDVITKQAEKLEAASMRIGYLEARSENYQNEIKLLTDSQHKRGWWSKFSSWFLGAQN